MTRPLNFLHITTFYPPYSFGGDAMYIYRLAHALGDVGHNVDVIHCLDSYHLLHPGEPEIQVASHPRVTTHGLRSEAGMLSPLLTQQTGRPYLKADRIREVINSKPYDVVHFHNMSLIGPKLMTVEANGGRAVKLYTAHEHWLVCPTHVLWKFNRRVCEKPECLKCTILAGRPPQIWRYSSLLADSSRHVDQFLSPSRFSAQMHAERGFTEPLAQLPYFIDRTDADWMSPGSRPQERPYFLFVGRLEVIKGLGTLIQAWRDVPFDLLVAGSGTAEQDLRRQAASNPRIRFLGPMSQKQLGGLYFHALACIVPSVTIETFGIIVIEAFARKTPVIVRDLGPLPEVVNDSGGGLVYRTNEELLAAIKTIAESPTVRAERGENGYRAFIEKWSTEPHLEMYFSYLRSAALRRLGYVPWEPEALNAAIPVADSHGRSQPSVTPAMVEPSHG